MEKSNIDTNPKNLVKEFKADKVIMKLKGEAPTQHNPNPVDISGTITAPSRFLENRKGEFYDKKAYCKASISDGTLELVVNEQSTCDKYTIKGSVIIGKLFRSLGINKGVEYTALKLASKLKMLRAIFPSVEDHRKIVTTLRNLKANVEKQVEQSTDDRANASVVFKQTVESNMPESFKVHLPLLEGEEPETINIEVVLEVHGNEIVCFLESIDGAEKLDNLREKLVKEQVSIIEKDVLVIYH